MIRGRRSFAAVCGGLRPRGLLDEVIEQRGGPAARVRGALAVGARALREEALDALERRLGSERPAGRTHVRPAGRISDAQRRAAARQRKAVRDNWTRSVKKNGGER